MLIAEMAAWCKKQNMTLYEALQSLYRKYGYYGESAASIALTGKDGLEKTRRIMHALRANPPCSLSGARVTAVRDYLKGVRTCDGQEEPTGLPTSDVLYYEMEDGAWICIRPSGTEPKVKIYVNAVANVPERTRELLDGYMAAATELLEDAGK